MWVKIDVRCFLNVATHNLQNILRIVEFNESKVVDHCLYKTYSTLYCSPASYATSSVLLSGFVVSRRKGLLATIV
jgi:hypothetical protein